MLIFFTKLLSKAASLFGGGSSLPGRLALKLDKHILSYAARGYKIILVTGTNGKTTTCSMLCGMLRAGGYTVINNSSGANMLSGITTCFIDNYRFGKQDERIAVIETDEAYMRHVTAELSPAYLVITNLFRDQLDRFGEVYTTWDMIKEAIVKAPASTLLFNGDEALFAGVDFPNSKLYYGFLEGSGENPTNSDSMFCHKCGAPYQFQFVTFQNLGNYVCPNCGLRRPPLTYTVDKINALSIDGSDVVLNGQAMHIGVPGLYNVYNALAAFAAARELGVEPDAIAKSLDMQESKFGRHEIIPIENAKAHMVLIKNPTGCNQCINTVLLERDPCSLLFMLNDNYADGTDVSWIWDAEFERLRTMPAEKILIGGTRRYDMAIRLKAAGLDKDKFILCPDFQAVTEQVKDCAGMVYAFATYTAMTGFRKHLFSLGYVKNMWK